VSKGRLVDFGSLVASFLSFKKTKESRFIYFVPIHRQVLRYAPDTDELLALFRKDKT